MNDSAKALINPYLSNQGNQVHPTMMNKISIEDNSSLSKQNKFQRLNRKGKQKMASACQHGDKLHYSNGLCQSCYLAQYYQKRKQKMAQKEASKSSKTEIVSKNQSENVSEKQASIKDVKQCQQESTGQKENSVDDVKEPAIEKKQCIE